MSTAGTTPSPPRQLTSDQRRMAEEEFNKINRLSQQYGLNENQTGQPPNQ
jgi:hypothetical protein